MFLSAFIGHCSFIQGKIQSGEDKFLLLTEGLNGVPLNSVISKI